MFVAVKLSWLPAHIGLLLAAIGVVPNEFTITKVVAGLEEQPFSVTTTDYRPAIAEVTPVIVGFC